jgi:Fe-S cluster assembly protein SufD
VTSFTVETGLALPGPAWLRDARAAAARRLEGAAWPSSAAEEWRYSRIDAFDPDGYVPAPRPAAPPVAPEDDLVAAAGEAFARLETVDGWVRAAEGPVRVLSAAEADDQPVHLGEIAGEPDRFTLMSAAFAPDPAVIEVPAGAPRRVVVVHRFLGEGVAAFPRVVLRAAAGAEVSVVEILAGPARALAVPVTEIDVGPAARVEWLQVQTLGDEAWQVALQASRVSRDASFLSAAVAFGGDYARVRTDSHLTGPGASSRLVAMYFGAGTQMHDFRTVQRHAAEKTTSDLLYKGVVANQARSVYSGLIRVEKGARGTNAFQTNRNLVLHEGAHADSVPNLEIEDNDVRCSHASAVGPISEDDRFYLESRGVPPEVAARLISLGFLGEVVESLPVAPVARWVHSALATKLARAEEDEAAGGRR